MFFYFYFFIKIQLPNTIRKYNYFNSFFELYFTWKYNILWKLNDNKNLQDNASMWVQLWQCFYLSKVLLWNATSPFDAELQRSAGIGHIGTFNQHPFN